MRIKPMPAPPTLACQTFIKGRRSEMTSNQPNSDPKWDIIQRYIEGVKTVTWTTKKSKDSRGDVKEEVYIQVTVATESEPMEHSLNDFNKIWQDLPAQIGANDSFLVYLTKRKASIDLNEKESMISDLKNRKLSNLLSSEMNGLRLMVNIPNSLTNVLLAATLDDMPLDMPQLKVEFSGDHSVSIVLQTPELDIKHLSPSSVSDLNEKLWNGRLVSNISRRDTQQSYRDNFSVAGLNLKETVFEGMVNSTQAIVALLIVLEVYPKSWRKDFLWDAWLAVTIQLCLLARPDLKDEDPDIWPCIWMKQIFYAETLVEPSAVKHLLLGQDPPAGAYYAKYLSKTTGIAFHAPGAAEIISSITKIKERYGLNCDDNNPKEYCQNGLLMVNMIRCIPHGNDSVSKNRLRNAWIAYTLKLVHYFSSRQVPVIMLCTFPTVLPEIYIPKVCTGQNLVQAPHPTSPYTQGHEDSMRKVCELLQNYAIEEQ